MALKPQPLCCRGCGETVPAPAVGEYEVVCECGAVSNAVYNSEEEYRIFEPEDEGKRHYVSYTREDSAEVPVPATDEKTRKWAETRVNQVKMLLSHLDSDQPGRKYLSVDEVRRAVRDLRAATHEYARCPDEGAEKASPVFWAIAAAQNVAARRRAEWTTDTESMAEAWSMDSLHAYLSQFQSESQVTAERLGNATRVGGSSGMSHAARLVDDQTRRRLSIYALGDSTARRVKLCTLDSLLKKAGRPGLAEPVLAQKLPRVVSAGREPGASASLPAALAAQPAPSKQAASAGAENPVIDDGLEAELEAELAADSSDGEETVVPSEGEMEDEEEAGGPEEVEMGEGEEDQEQEEQEQEQEQDAVDSTEDGAVMEVEDDEEDNDDSGDETERVEGAPAVPALAVAPFAVGVAPPKRRRGQLSLKEFLSTPGATQPGAVKAWQKERAEERRLERVRAEQKQKRAEATARARVQKASEKQARADAKEAERKEKEEARAFESEVRHGGKLEEARHRGGFVAEPISSSHPTTIKIRGYLPKIKLTAEARAIAERNAGAEVWACCDLCKKWRLLPRGAKQPGKDEPWHCSHNPDLTHSFCGAIEDPRAWDSAASAPSRQPHNGLPYTVVRIKMAKKRTLTRR